jgi:ABC-type multidrug transport system fused ATPase/permease subunit
VASAAAAAAAAILMLFMTTAAVLTMFSMTASAILIVVSALMTLAVMMITIGSAVDKFTPEVHLYSSIRVAGRTRADLDPGVPERVQSAAAKSAADEDLYILIRKKAGQRSVADAIGTEHPTVNDLVVFYLVNFEIFCSSKVLKDISVVVSCRDFHNYPF